MDFTWVKHKEEVEVNNARIFKDYSNLEFASERVQLLERRFETKWFDYLDWKRENPARHIAPAREKKRKLRLEGSDEESSEQNCEFKIKKTKSGPVSDTESDDNEDNAILDAGSMKELEPKPEPELKPAAIPKTISNTVADYSWVDAEDELDVATALAVKDFTQLYRKGERIQLLEKLFENGWLKYCEWRREREFEQEYGSNQDLDFENKYIKDLGVKAPMEKKTSKDENGSNAKKSNIAAWYEMSSSEDEDEEERKSEIDESKSYINSSIDFTSLFAKANSTDDILSSSSIHENNANSLDDEKDEDKTRGEQTIKDKSISEIDKNTSFYYDADDEAEFDKEMEW
ncbi:hypothetical protein CAEBREN_12973 [Caenorhabditis brenneri]|uniref:Uncharacterized protein n=1 Tax=Caenorhabditis brenneri TaxID=135651 RepID=G0MBF3_CAEBE|nr:hypothetical protein CAEBREN_12973 [Caenorhabditis brenneri]